MTNLLTKPREVLCIPPLSMTSIHPMSDQVVRRPMRLLALHGFRTSGNVIRSQLDLSLLSQQLKDFVQIYTLDAPNSALGPADPTVHSNFDGPFYEWWNAVEDPPGTWEYKGWERTVAHVWEYVRSRGPIHGLLGFSQGASLAAALTGLQQNGVIMEDVPKFEVCVCISGFKPRFHGCDMAFQQPITCPSLHIWGTKDSLARASEALIGSFIEPTVVKHERGHVIPKLEGEALDVVKDFFSTRST